MPERLDPEQNVAQEVLNFMRDKAVKGQLVVSVSEIQEGLVAKFWDFNSVDLQRALLLLGGNHYLFPTGGIAVIQLTAKGLTMDAPPPLPESID